MLRFATVLLLALVSQITWLAPLPGASISDIDPDQVDIQIIEGEMPEEEKRQILQQIGVLTDDDLEVDLDTAIDDQTLTVSQPDFYFRSTVFCFEFLPIDFCWLSLIEILNHFTPKRLYWVIIFEII